MGFGSELVFLVNSSGWVRFGGWRWVRGETKVGTEVKVVAGVGDRVVV